MPISSLMSSHQTPRIKPSLRLQAADVPALFSEGPEPEMREGKPWWPVEPMKLRVRMSWPLCLDRMARRAKPAIEA